MAKTGGEKRSKLTKGTDAADHEVCCVHQVGEIMTYIPTDQLHSGVLFPQVFSAGVLPVLVVDVSDK